jgi:hypothetical protein
LRLLHRSRFSAMLCSIFPSILIVSQLPFGDYLSYRFDLCAAFGEISSAPNIPIESSLRQIPSRYRRSPSRCRLAGTILSCASSRICGGLRRSRHLLRNLGIFDYLCGPKRCPPGIFLVHFVLRAPHSPDLSSTVRCADFLRCGSNHIIFPKRLRTFWQNYDRDDFFCQQHLLEAYRAGGWIF